MKRIYVAVALIALSLGVTGRADAQMGMSMFQKPAIAKFFNPVVGKGAQYETTRTGHKEGKATSLEMAVVGKESVNGKDGFWMQFVTTDEKGQPMVGKMLFTSDMQSQRMIMQMKGQPAMEMPFNPAANRENKMEANMADWHQVGTESITVPAGTFTCEHWKNDKNGSELWASDKVSPFGMVKQVSKDDTMVLTKVLSDVPDRITGPVSKFDPQMMMQQMQGEHPQKP
jgi:hypothetical protein